MAHQLVRHATRARILLVALAMVGLVAALLAARPAHATGSPFISASGGPGEVWVGGNGFTPGATVRLVALTDPGLNSVSGSVYTTADAYGNIGTDLYNLAPFTGAVYVAADQLSPAPALGTVWTTTTVKPEPRYLSVGQRSCGYPVTVNTYGFEDYYNVRFELLPDNLSRTLDVRQSTSDFEGDASPSPALGTTGYTGWAWVVADEWGTGEFGGLVPAPATIWYHLYVC